MIRRIIEIDQKKCNGCGLCASACHEGAIGMVDGKAALLKDDYCDGLGDCLPACPTGAISFVEREAAAYDEAAVQVHMAARKAKQVLENANTAASANASARPAFSGCPGSMSRFLKRTESAPSEHDDTHADSAETFNPSDSASIPVSALQNWPVQIKLAPIPCTVFRWGKAPGRCRLHRLRIQPLPSGLYPW